MRIAVALLALSSVALADDWPQFRGSGGRGVSHEKGLPVEWGKDKGIRWTVDLPGRGLSSPVIVGDNLYLTACTGFEQERLHVICLDARTGKERWRRQLTVTGSTQCNRKTNMAAPTPVADANRVFALFATCDLVAFDKDGGLLWYRSLKKDYPTIGNNVGMAASPALHGDTLFIAMENVGDSFVAGIDARTGQNRWRHAKIQTINWTTPIVVTREGETEVVFQSPNELTAYAAVTGLRRWSFEGGRKTKPSPVAADGLIFAPGGSFVALRPSQGAAEKVWENDKVATETASPVVYKGRLYTLNSAGIVTCSDPRTGKEIWRSRASKQKYSATPVAAEDRLYLLSEKGAMTVMQLGDEPRVIAVNKLDDTFLASPAVAHGAIYLRSDKKLYCIGKKQP